MVTLSWKRLISIFFIRQRVPSTFRLTGEFYRLLYSDASPKQVSSLGEGAEQDSQSGRPREKAVDDCAQAGCRRGDGSQTPADRPRAATRRDRGTLGSL